MLVIVVVLAKCRTRVNLISRRPSRIIRFNWTIRHSPMLLSIIIVNVLIKILLLIINTKSLTK